jgi:hypothetical protein
MTGATLLTAAAEDGDWPRDRYGRPLIADQQSGQPVPYSRASSIASVIEDQYGLSQWRMRMVSIGMARLAADGLIPDGAGQMSPSDVAGLAETAFARGGGTDAAQLGTAIHETLRHMLDTGDEPDGETVHGRVVSAAVHMIRSIGMVPVATEQRIVWDDEQIAGTCDLVLGDPKTGRLMIADLKTGRTHPGLSATAQLAAYAAGVPWTAAGRSSWPGPVDQDTGIILWCPADISSDPRLLYADLAVGRTIISVAKTVKATRRVTGVRKAKP